MIATRQDMRRAVGQLFICGFEGQQPTAELKEILREIKPLGLILYSRNVDSVEQVSALNRELKMLRPKEPLLLCVDQEGGRVARLKKGVTLWPPMRAVGQGNDVGVAYAVGQALARELRAVHFDIDFAPVLDVDTNPQNPIIGDRAFASEAQQVGRMGAAFVRGLQETGVGACGKHFPGHGDTDVDSHLDLPKVGHDLSRLRQVEWPPFAAAIQAHLGAIMTAHVVMEVFGAEPATLCAQALRHTLRGELQFSGVIISDDIDMKAVADRYSPEEIGIRGLQAGCDVFLACRNPVSMLALYRGLVQAVEQSVISYETLLTAAQRACLWRNRYYQPPADFAVNRHWLGCAAHLSLAEKVRHFA